MTKQIALPSVPEFPASNASYSKIADKMHKAALNAATSAAAITAISSIRDHVKGVNTYSKKVRRYGDDLIAALGGKPSGEFVPLKGPKAKHTGPSDADVAKVASKAANIETAAKEGEPLATFMLKGAKAQKAVDAAAATGKSFSSKSNAKRGLVSAQLDHLPVEWEQDGDKVRPVVIANDDKGVAYAAERGFAAKVKA
jgi:hypothetical protein